MKLHLRGYGFPLPRLALSKRIWLLVLEFCFAFCDSQLVEIRYGFRLLTLQLIRPQIEDTYLGMVTQRNALISLNFIPIIR